MSAIEQCRSLALGGHALRCSSCAQAQIAYNSCRNRHSPKCWSHPGDADGWSASWYFDQILKRLNPAAVVDEKTWSDLEFPRFFKAIDTTVSLIGRQYLFAQLRIYEYEKAKLDECHHGYEILQGNRELREHIQLALRP